MPQNAVVIGAGLGGLAAACHLSGQGWDVTVLEREAVPGGRAGTLSLGGYRFDTGPTVFTMPELLRQSFDALGVEMDDFVRFRPLDPMYRGVFADGSTIRVRPGREAMTEEIRSTCGPDDAAEFGRFCDWLAELYQVEMASFIDRNYDSPLDLARPLGPALALLRMGGLRRLGGRVARSFRDERLQRLFSFQAMYAGLAPHEALAIYCVITYMDSVEGVFFPEGGMHAVPAGMAAAAQKAGIELRYEQTVERILLAAGSDGPVTGVRLASGEVVPADVVICNADLPVAYRSLLPGLEPPRTVRRGHYSPSAVVWHAGVRGLPPAEAGHHNIHFGQAWDAAFRAILHDGVRMPDPSLLVTMPSLTEPALAPPGCSTLYVLEPVPNLDGRIDWTAERGRIRDDLARRVAAFGYPTEVEVDELVDPLDWERQGMERGTPFALSHRFFQSGPFRPNNIDRRAPGLVFVGSGTVPGVGVPMVLVSGRLAAERAAAARRR